jgi:proteasome assembly chaperone 3
MPPSSSASTPAVFPSPSRTAAGTIGGYQTTATLTSFTDKHLLTLTQDGRLSHWVQVPLSASTPGGDAAHVPRAGGGPLLPSTHLTATTLLGGGGGDRETLGQLYAAHVASQLALRDPEDRRTLLVGFGLCDYRAEREVFFDVLELVTKVL